MSGMSVRKVAILLHYMLPPGPTIFHDDHIDGFYVIVSTVDQSIQISVGFDCKPVMRSQCQSTNIQEVVSCLGLEAVCWLFSNGSLAQSLGVNNAACRLLVDHMASRGMWRGVNRTSILTSSGTLNNITVEDPTKHLRHAAFLGIYDSTHGSSASILTGGRVSFGTSGFSIHMDIDSILRP